MIGSTLQQELMSIIMRELNDPRIEGLPSITRVKVSEDLSTADVFMTIMGSEGKQTAALNALKHSAGMMRQKLQKTLPMRTIPYLRFHIDENLKKEIAVLELIDKAVREENELKEKTRTESKPETPEQ
jgi:ribosome-binding factor A